MQIKEHLLHLSQKVHTVPMGAATTLLTLELSEDGAKAVLVVAEPDQTGVPMAARPPVAEQSISVLSSGDTAPRNSTYLGSVRRPYMGLRHLFLLSPNAPVVTDEAEGRA